jgi:O-antigen/teichoic acid export membrane protein
MNRTVRPVPPGDRSHTRALARGTVLAAVGKITHLIKPVAMLVFARLYGAEALGIYVLLLAYVTAVGRATILAMPKTLQRFVPANPSDAHAIVRTAVVASVGLGTLAALALTMLAPLLARFIQISDPSQGNIAPAVALCTWFVPLRALLRVPLHALRARQHFGPDIYVRTLLEPAVWLAAGVLFYPAGWGVYGLVGARIISLSVAGVVALGILLRRFEPARLLHPARLSRPSLRTEILRFSAVTVTYDVVHYLQSRLDLLLLGVLLSGPSGAAAIGAYGIARTLSVAVTSGRKSSDYAVAPIASALHARREIGHLRDSYAASTRWNLCTFVPIIAAILSLRTDLLGLFGTEFTVASTALVLLCLGRAIDEMTGPTALILAMVGRPLVPLLNDLGAALASAVLLWVLVPTFGITGAAIAAASGIALTSVAAHVEIRVILGIQPYDHRILRPLAFSGAGVAVFLGALWLGAQTGLLGVWARIAVTAVWAAGFVLVFLRYALPAEDRALADEGLQRLRARVRSLRSPTEALRASTDAR